jgi:hypothetical protein
MAELGSSKIYGNLTVSGDTDLKGQIFGLPAASLSGQGVVQLNNTLTSTSTEQALTAAQGKVLQDGKLSTTGKAADSDKLDGLDSSQFLRSDTSDQFTGQLTVDNRGKISSGYSWTGSAIQATSIEIIDANTNDETSCATMFMHNYGDGGVKFRMGNTGDKTLYLSSGVSNGAGSPTDDNSGTYFNAVKINNNTVWHTGNDGAGSGLDADLLDGVQLAAITRSGSTVTLTGDVTGSATVSATGSISIATTSSGGGITTGKAIAMAIVFG